MIPYSVSKGSQIILARSLAELTKGADINVTISSILPGPTATGGLKKYMEEFVEQKKLQSYEEAMKLYFKEYEPTSLHQRFLDPNEVANVVIFLCSPLASGINGHAQRVEGGIVRHL
jgi:NAD(P)-dependent dehydrogenase (short-subunit alcohol dehydrogenase family)